MKLKKWGALLLALCMIVMMFPTTVMANGDSLAGPDAEKKVIENDLIVQLPPSFDYMIGTSAGNGNWLAVVAEPTWEVGTILDFVHTTQEFYDSTGEKMTEDDMFQNDSRYTMKVTFRSFDSYHGDCYYVLSGTNGVYVTVNGQRDSMNVTVGEDANGNPVITATYSFSIGTPPEEPTEESTYEWVVSRMDDSADTPLDEITAVVGIPIEYRAQLIETLPDGTKSAVSTSRIDLQWHYNVKSFTNTDTTVTEYAYGYTITVTGTQNTDERDELILYTNSFGDPHVEAHIWLNVVEPAEIELGTVYTVSGKSGQDDLYYQYYPEDVPEGESYQAYTLWTEGGTVKGKYSVGIAAGETIYRVFHSTTTDPINFQFTPTADDARFELVEAKPLSKIEFLSVPDSIIQNIRENGAKADLNGFTFKVTYKDGSTRTYEYSGTKVDYDDYSVHHMDWTPDGTIYDCSYDSENNAISLLALRDGGWIEEFYKIPDESNEKVNITEGLSKVTGDLGNTEYDTVEKIESKLTETIVSSGEYSADNTVLYDIEFVTSEDGGETWAPVTADNFPAEGIEVTLPYPEGTNGAEYDFTVVHMFDEDVNGHKAGEVETPEVTESANGISFRLMGTSPVMLGYKKAAVPHTHSYGAWTDCKDGSNHQRTCSCGAVQKEAHVWDEGKVTKEAAKDAEGIKTYTCKTCGATKTESIPKLTSGTTPSTPGDSANPNTDTTSPKTGDSANIALWIIVMLVSAAGLSCTYFVRRKNKI